jgi:hypothetical protein
MTSTPWHKRVDSADWDAITAELNDFGGALLPRLLTKAEAETIRRLYADDHLFRATIDMRRYRFGEGEYRYFQQPYPRPIQALKEALYPRLLPVARDWWMKLRRLAPWPDTLEEWLDMCHDAGQTKSTAILLKYGKGDWNALHRDLYGDLVFPLQVVINLSVPGIDHTGGEFLLVEQRPRAQTRGTATLLPFGHGAGPHRPCVTAFRPSARASGSHSGSSSTMRADSVFSVAAARSRCQSMPRSGRRLPARPHRHAPAPSPHPVRGWQ